MKLPIILFKKKKTEIITFYNMTNIAVDLLHQLCRNNDVTRYTRTCPMVLFYNLLNISAINAFCYINIIKLRPMKTSRAEFLEILSWPLNKASNTAETLSRKLLVMCKNSRQKFKNPPDRSRGRCYI